MSETGRRKAATEMKARALILLKDTLVFGKLGIIMVDQDDGTVGVKGKDGKPWSYSMLMAAFAAKEADSALLEAAGLVCQACDSPELYEVSALRQGNMFPSRWMHKSKEDGIYTGCAAYKIHERRAQKGNG